MDQRSRFKGGALDDEIDQSGDHLEYCYKPEEDRVYIGGQRIIQIIADYNLLKDAG